MTEGAERDGDLTLLRQVGLPLDGLDGTDSCLGGERDQGCELP